VGVGSVGDLGWKQHIAVSVRKKFQLVEMIVVTVLFFVKLYIIRSYEYCMSHCAVTTKYVMLKITIWATENPIICARGFV